MEIRKNLAGKHLEGTSATRQEIQRLIALFFKIRRRTVITWWKNYYSISVGQALIICLCILDSLLIKILIKIRWKNCYRFCFTNLGKQKKEALL
jgi:hypothetical protein